MSFVARGTRAAARPLRQPKATIRQSTRRNASSHDSHHEAAHGESAHHADPGSGKEGFGKGFYVTLAAIPILYLTYNLSTSTDNVIQRFYKNYQANLAKKDAQDVLHSKALEQAISDRSVLYENKANHARDLRYTEFFNVGSPWNVAAGEGTANLSKLREHYNEERQKMEKVRMEAKQ